MIISIKIDYRLYIRIHSNMQTNTAIKQELLKLKNQTDS